MIVLRDDIQDELGHHRPVAAFEKALVLLGLYDQIIGFLQDEHFIQHLRKPQNLEGGKLLQSLSSGDLAQYLEQHSEVLRQTYFEGLLTLMRLNQQLNLKCELQSWNRPNAEGQKQLPDPDTLHPALKHLLEQRLSLCQQIVELTLGLLQSELDKISLAAQQALTPNNLEASAQAPDQMQGQAIAQVSGKDNDKANGKDKVNGKDKGLNQVSGKALDQAPGKVNTSKGAALGSEANFGVGTGSGADADEGIEVTLSLLPTVPVCPDILEMTDKDIQQLYVKYQKILQLVLSTERLTCLGLRALTILPTSNTKLKDLGLQDTPQRARTKA